MTNRSCDLKSKITDENEVVAILSYLYLTIVLLNYLHYHPIVEIIPVLRNPSLGNLVPGRLTLSLTPHHDLMMVGRELPFRREPRASLLSSSVVFDVSSTIIHSKHTLQIPSRGGLVMRL